MHKEKNAQILKKLFSSFVEEHVCVKEFQAKVESKVLSALPE